jgi:hypothetical protein
VYSSVTKSVAAVPAKETYLSADANSSANARLYRSALSLNTAVDKESILLIRFGRNLRIQYEILNFILIKYYI